MVIAHACIMITVQLCTVSVIHAMPMATARTIDLLVCFCWKPYVVEEAMTSMRTVLHYTGARPTMVTVSIAKAIRRLPRMQSRMKVVLASSNMD